MRVLTPLQQQLLRFIDELPANQPLDSAVVRAALCMSRATFDRRRTEFLPPPRKVGRVNRWMAGDVRRARARLMEV